MKSFRDLTMEVVKTSLEVEALEENIAEGFVSEGKEKIIKVVKDGKGGFKKKKTFTCSGESQKYNPSTKKCVSVSGAEKAKKKKGAKKRTKTLAKTPQSVKDKKARKMAKAKQRFGLNKK